MALPLVTAATKAARKKPKALSPEGITMLVLAGILDIVNILIGFLDFVFGLGIIIGPIFNFAGTILIGFWQWFRLGKFPVKKAFLPLLGKSIPFAKFFPWWLLSVATSLDWKGMSDQPAETQQQEPEEESKEESGGTEETQTTPQQAYAT
jgi:hypothetical protein